MKVLSSNLTALIVTLFAVAFVIGMSLTAVGQPDSANPGQPFEQIEAKLDKMGPSVIETLAKLEGKLDKQETKLDTISQRLDRLTPIIAAMPKDIENLETQLKSVEAKLDTMQIAIDRLEAKLDGLSPD